MITIKKSQFEPFCDKFKQVLISKIEANKHKKYIFLTWDSIDLIAIENDEIDKEVRSDVQNTGDTTVL